MMRINLTAIIAILAIVFVLIIGGLVVLTVTGHDGGAYVSTIGVLLSTAASVWLIVRQSSQSRAIQKVDHQTNGTLSELRAENLSLRNKLNMALSKLPESKATEVIEHTISRDEISA